MLTITNRFPLCTRTMSMRNKILVCACNDSASHLCWIDASSFPKCPAPYFCKSLLVFRTQSCLHSSPTGRFGSNVCISIVFWQVLHFNLHCTSLHKCQVCDSMCENDFVNRRLNLRVLIVICTCNNSASKLWGLLIEIGTRLKVTFCIFLFSIDWLQNVFKSRPTGRFGSNVLMVSCSNRFHTLIHFADWDVNVINPA